MRSKGSHSGCIEKDSYWSYVSVAFHCAKEQVIVRVKDSSLEIPDEGRTHSKVLELRCQSQVYGCYSSKDYDHYHSLLIMLFW